MSTFTATRPVTLAPSVCEEHLDDAEQARVEHLESLPARLEPEALAQVMDLHEQGKTPRTIGGRLSLHPLVVSIEVRRELERRAEEQQAVRSTSATARGRRAPPPRLPGAARRSCPRC